MALVDVRVFGVFDNLKISEAESTPIS